MARQAVDPAPLPPPLQVYLGLGVGRDLSCLLPKPATQHADLPALPRPSIQHLASTGHKGLHRRSKRALEGDTSKATVSRPEPSPPCPGPLCSPAPAAAPAAAGQRPWRVTVLARFWACLDRAFAEWGASGLDSTTIPTWDDWWRGVWERALLELATGCPAGREDMGKLPVGLIPLLLAHTTYGSCRKAAERASVHPA